METIEEECMMDAVSVFGNALMNNQEIVSVTLVD